MGDLAYVDIRERMYNGIRARINDCFVSGSDDDLVKLYIRYGDDLINYLLWDIDDRVATICNIRVCDSEIVNVDNISSDDW